MSDINISNEIKHHFLRRLAHIVVGNEENILKSALTFFIEQALLEIGHNKSQREIIAGIRNNFYLNFQNAEVVDVLNERTKTGFLVCKSGKYTLEINREKELKEKNTKAKSFEESIFSDWIELISAKYPDLSDGDKVILVSDLQLYLNKIFLQHGAECTVLIYPEEDKLNALIKQYSQENLDKLLPERSDILKKIRTIEFPLFLRCIDNEKKVYFAGILDGTFVYNLIQIDPQTQKLVRDNFKNYTIYLDTNILYSLFDLHNSQRTTVIEKAINLSRQFGIKIVVSHRTVEEMKKSIALKKEALLSSSPIRRDLAEIGAEISEEEDFITSYWRAYYKTGVSKEDFIEKLSHVADLLKSKNIPVIKGLDFTSETIEKEKDILKDSISPRRKTDVVAEHDAYHCLLIKELRKEADIKQSNEKYWFLSLDSVLLIYDVETRAQGEVPFVLLPHQLLQILRPFGQRTHDYDATFIELFSRPQIKSAHGILPNNLAQKILAKISGFSDLPAETALSIIMDQTFRKSVVVIQDMGEQDKFIEQKIESTVATELKQYKERLEKLELESEKQNRITEAKINQKDNKVEQQDKSILFYKNLSFYVTLILLLLLSFLAYKNLWVGATKIQRCMLIAADMALLYLVGTIKWKPDKVYNIIMGLIAILNFILFSISL
ncbi:MAG: hypothetical protein WA092_01545 [Minisyncoccales bacterium]